MPLKTFRGILGDGEKIKINLKHKDGRIGYRVKKFQVIPATPGSNIDAVVKIWKVNPGTAVGTVDLSDNTLLAVAWNYNDTYETETIIVFDQEIFNQDIHVQHYDDKASNVINYYIELEQFKIDSDEATMATLKNMRNTATQTAG